jgi:hypothetical protein
MRALAAESEDAAITVSAEGLRPQSAIRPGSLPSRPLQLAVQRYANGARGPVATRRPPVPCTGGVGHAVGAAALRAGSAALARAVSARAYTGGDEAVFGTDRPVARMLQRSITLTDPGGTIPHPAGAMGPFPTKQWELNSWLDTLCPDGNWNVDPGTGVVDSPDRATFCSARPAWWDIHHSTSRHPTSCGCLCDLTAPGSFTVQVQIDENLTVGAHSIPLIPQGEAATTHISATDKISAFTGREFVGITGAGATTPHAGTGRAQTIPDPPWVIFGHEVCGHARLQSGPMGPTQAGHATTPAGDVTTVDIENRIRREHSTVASSLGIRGSTFAALDAGGNFVQHAGAVYTASAGETVSGIAVRCGLSVVDMLDHMWRFNGDRITMATRNTLAAGERLLIEGIDWHEVIKGETMTSVAATWGVALASLQRANPSVTGPSFWIRPGDRLLIPAA